jgi:yeast amino acid transporter
MADAEKQAVGGTTPPAYDKEPAVNPDEHHEYTGREEDFMTRNGLNLKSFQRRDYGQSIVELDRSMKPRHLQMIAIGTF